MLRRLVLFGTALVLVAAIAPAALAARVHVRVEGKTTTIFGAPEPFVAPAATPLEALEDASVLGEFFYHVKQFSFGPFVDQIGRYSSSDTGGWLFKVNGVLPQVGADKVTLKDGDRVLWYWSSFSSSGPGEKTLLLTRRSRNCYQVVAQDDGGARTVVPGTSLRVDGRTKVATGGAACVGKHRGLVRAFAPGAVRSNALA
ncbi:MAG TPA: DUF4430 domain-containing protein [Gaiellaceae bacterium]